jgi:hypothetical protein
MSYNTISLLSYDHISDIALSGIGCHHSIISTPGILLFLESDHEVHLLLVTSHVRVLAPEL